MVEILPIKSLRDEDSPIFGSLNVALGKLDRLGFPIGRGFIIAPPEFHLKTILEQYDFGTKEVFQQSLALVRKDIENTPVPAELLKEVGIHSDFYVFGREIKSVKNLWITLLNLWIDQIGARLWKDGFYPGVTENLEPQIVILVTKLEAFGVAYFESELDEVIINIKSGKLEPKDLKKLDEIIRLANKKLLIPQTYEFILDTSLKIVKVVPYTPSPAVQVMQKTEIPPFKSEKEVKKSTVKVFLDLSKSLSVEEGMDGVYIASEKIFDLNKPQDSFETLVFKLVESAATYPHNPILYKLADKSEGMGKVRGALRLMHQKNLWDPLIEAADFVRHKKGLTNVHLVIPFLRGTNELLSLKRELAVAKLARKNSLQLWIEVAVPENIINLEDYLLVGVDGIVLNLDELAGLFGGFDIRENELTFYNNMVVESKAYSSPVVSSFAYKKEVNGLLKFMEDALKLLHKSRIPFVATGSLTLYPEVLDFLVDKGVFGIVVERFEAHSAKDLLHQAERKMILRRAT